MTAITRDDTVHGVEYVTKHEARQLGSYLSHFTQHGQLPKSWPLIEYHI